jgi:anti-sigma factor (TIGR02949 family)
MTSEPGECSKIVEVLVDYLEGHLPPRVRAELDQHLSKCQDCVDQLQTYRATVSLLRTLCDEDLPSELRSSVATFLQSRTIH